MNIEHVRVGTLVRGFGIKGEVKVRILTDFPLDRFQVDKKLIWKKDAQSLELTIASVRYHQKHVLLSFDGYPDLTSVEPLVGGDFWIKTTELPQDGTRYAFEYVDCDVYDEKNNLKGRISEVMDAPAHAILRVKTDAKDILIPLVNAFIVDVDFKQKKVVVRWMDGL